MVNEIVKDGIYEIKKAKTIKKAHVQLISLDEIRNIMESVGFVDVQILTKVKSPWNAVLARK